MQVHLFSGHRKEVQPARVGLPTQGPKPTAEWGMLATRLHAFLCGDVNICSL